MKATSPLSGNVLDPRKSGRLSHRKQSISDHVSAVDSTDDNARGLNLKIARKQNNLLGQEYT